MHCADCASPQPPQGSVSCALLRPTEGRKKVTLQNVRHLHSLKLGCQAEKDTDSRWGKPCSFWQSSNRSKAKPRKMRGRVTPAAPRHEPAVIFAYKKLFIRDNLQNAKLAGILQPRLSGDM